MPWSELGGEDKQVLADYLQQMIDDGRLDGKLAGIAERFILNERPLSDKEKWVFENEIYEPYLKRVCKITGEEIGPTDLEVHDEYGMSSETARSYVSFMNHD